MGTHNVTAAKRQAGFTLVELAVVMIIIGLLIGGVLKGQELITNAQVTSAVSQMKGMDAGVTTFRDTYAALPGDMLNAGGANGRLPNCNACGNGNGNNRIDVAAGTAPTAGDESALIWTHLSAADLINGVDSTGNLTFGESLPEASIGGGYLLGFHQNGGGLNGADVDPRTGHYLALTGDPAVNVGAGTSAVLRASQAARIDRKMDDGAPNTGSIIAAVAGGGTRCMAAGGGAAVIYDEANDPLDCALYFRIQQ